MDSLIRTRQINSTDLSGFVLSVLNSYLNTGQLTGLAINTGQLTGQFYPLYTNPDSYITSGQTGSFATQSFVLGYNGGWQTYVAAYYYPLSNPSGYVSLASGGNFYLSFNVPNTGNLSLYDSTNNVPVIDFQTNDHFILNSSFKNSRIVLNENGPVGSPYLSGFNFYSGNIFTTGINGQFPVTPSYLSSNFVPLWQFNTVVWSGFHALLLSDTTCGTSFSFNGCEGFTIIGSDERTSNDYVIDFLGLSSGLYNVQTNIPYILGFDIFGRNIYTNNNRVLSTLDISTGLVSTYAQLIGASGSLQTAINYIQGGSGNYVTESQTGLFAALAGGNTFTGPYNNFKNQVNLGNNLIVSGNQTTYGNLLIFDNIVITGAGMSLFLDNGAFIYHGMLYDSNDTEVLSWQSTELYDNNPLLNVTSLDWTYKLLYDDSSNISLDWKNRILSGNWNIGSTGNFITKSQTGIFITTGQTGKFITTSQTGIFVTTSQTGQFGQFIPSINIGGALSNIAWIKGGITFSETSYGVIISGDFAGIQFGVGGAIYDHFNNLTIDPDNRLLTNLSSINTVDWQNLILTGGNWTAQGLAPYYIGAPTIGTVTNGIYGGTSSVAGIDVGDTHENAYEKIELILQKLAPSKPLSLSLSNFILTGTTYNAYMQGTNTIFNNIISGGKPTGYATGFYDGSTGNLSGFINNILTGLTALSIGLTGNFTGLTVFKDADYYSGIQGKANFWYYADAYVSPFNATLNTGKFTMQLSHTTAGTTNLITGYCDYPITPLISGISVQTGIVNLHTIDGVPSLSVGDNITVFYTIFSGISAFYSPAFSSILSSQTNQATINVTGAPLSGSIQNLSGTVTVNNNVYAVNWIPTVQASNSLSSTISSTGASTLYIDSVSSLIANRVIAGTGQFTTSYGGTYNTNTSLILNEELQQISGLIQNPPSINYSTCTPSGPNYSAIQTGTYKNYRWSCFNVESINNVNSINLTFNNTNNFGNSTIVSGMLIYILVSGYMPTNGWIDANNAYPGVGSPTNNGDAALDISSSSSTFKRITFGSAVKSGVVYARIGLPSGSNKSFSSITAS